MNIVETIEQVTTPTPSKLARKIGKRKPAAPVEHPEDPVKELRLLVGLHKRWVQTARMWTQSVSDRKFTQPDGTVRTIKCTLPDAIRGDIGEVAKRLNAEAKSLESAMTRQLRQIPIYNEFLSKVWGFGPVCCSYLVSMIRIDRCVKPSQLNRYCGNACDPKTGKRELRSGAPRYSAEGEFSPEATGTYNDELKMRIWQGMSAMYKNGAKKSEARPHGTTTKYLDRWINAVHARKTMGRALGANNAGRRKATDLFLEDLYMVWRTLEGLPVWPDLYSVRRGFFHGGKPCVNEGRPLTLAEAWHSIGDVGPRAALAPIADLPAEDDVEDAAE